MNNSKWDDRNSENKPRGLYFSKALFEGLTFGPLVGRKFMSVICTKFLLKLAIRTFSKTQP